MELTRRIDIGDNLEILSSIHSHSVELVYLDPPFNSGRTYESRVSGSRRESAFSDLWVWGAHHDLLLRTLETEVPQVLARTVRALIEAIGRGGMTAYLLEMSLRLAQVHRILTPTGSIYLHCDPSASHLLRVVLDALFGAPNFRNEIIWQRTHAHSGSRRFGPVHDTILYYTKTARYTWNQGFSPYSTAYLANHFTKSDERGRYQLITCTGPGDRVGTRAHYEWRGQLPPTGRHWAWTAEKMAMLESEGRLVYSRNGIPRYKRYSDDGEGVRLQDVWLDVQPLSAHSAERTGYDTQKPVALIERIIRASSNPGDLVVDPFVGSGSTAIAAERLKRSWRVSDRNTLAASLTLARVRAELPGSIVEISGHPQSETSLEALRTNEPTAFAAWCTALLAAQLDRKAISHAAAVGTRGSNPGLVTLVPLGADASVELGFNLIREALLLDGAGARSLISSVKESGVGRLDVVPRAALAAKSVAETGLADHDLRIA